MRRPPSNAPCSCTRRCVTGSSEIERIVIETQEPGVRIIDKTGPLANPADRDHCLQYMVGRAADLRTPHGGGLRRPGRRAIRASTRLRAQDGGQGERRPSPGVLRARQTLHRQCRAGVLQRRHQHRAGAGRLPDRPSQTARRRHAGAGEKICGQRPCALPSGACAKNPVLFCRSAGPGRHAGG